MMMVISPGSAWPVVTTTLTIRTVLNAFAFPVSHPLRPITTHRRHDLTFASGRKQLFDYSPFGSCLICGLGIRSLTLIHFPHMACCPTLSYLRLTSATWLTSHVCPWVYLLDLSLLPDPYYMWVMRLIVQNWICTICESWDSLSLQTHCTELNMYYMWAWYELCIVWLHKKWREVDKLTNPPIKETDNSFNSSIKEGDNLLSSPLKESCLLNWIENRMYFKEKRERNEQQVSWKSSDCNQ